MTPTPSNSDTDLALARGFASGDYASAYETESLEEALRRRAVSSTTASYRAAFVLGFFASYGDREIPEAHVAEVQAARDEYGPRMRAIGIAID